MSEGTFAGEAHGFDDLYSVSDDLVIEHWDARRQVPASTASGLPAFGFVVSETPTDCLCRGVRARVRRETRSAPGL